MQEQQKAGKQDRKDSINSSVYNLNGVNFFPLLKICSYRVGLYTELFYAIIPPSFPWFLLICYPYILLHL